LWQNYPNPFNPKTIINYELPITNYVDLSIYNMLGQKIETLVSKKQNPGRHQVEWNAKNMPSGVYYYILNAGGFQEVKKMILLK
jgi:flagellar hook assembly protein FlgD